MQRRLGAGLSSAISVLRMIFRVGYEAQTRFRMVFPDRFAATGTESQARKSPCLGALNTPKKLGSKMGVLEAGVTLAQGSTDDARVARGKGSSSGAVGK